MLLVPLGWTSLWRAFAPAGRGRIRHHAGFLAVGAAEPHRQPIEGARLLLARTFPFATLFDGRFVPATDLPWIEIHEGYVSVGTRIIPWMDIRRLDRTGWISPLIIRITLFDDSRLLLVYPGDLDSCNSLLRHLRRLSRDALIDGIPYRQYWGEVLAPTTERKQQPPCPATAYCVPKTKPKWNVSTSG